MASISSFTGLLIFLLCVGVIVSDDTIGDNQETKSLKDFNSKISDKIANDVISMVLISDSAFINDDSKEAISILDANAKIIESQHDFTEHSKSILLGDLIEQGSSVGPSELLKQSYLRKLNENLISLREKKDHRISILKKVINARILNLELNSSTESQWTRTVSPVKLIPIPFSQQKEVKNNSASDGDVAEFESFKHTDQKQNEAVVPKNRLLTIATEILTGMDSINSVPPKVPMICTGNDAEPIPNNVGRIRGIIVDALTGQAPTKSITITFEHSEGACVVLVDTTGHFMIYLQKFKTHLFGRQRKLLVQTEGYVPTVLFTTVEVSKTINIESVYLPPISTNVGNAFGFIESGTTKKIIRENGKFTIRRGQNNVSDNPEYFVKKDWINSRTGGWSAAGLNPGVYTFEFDVPNRVVDTKTVVIAGNNTSDYSGRVFLLPIEAPNIIRFVLTWASLPKNLDLHVLYIPSGKDVIELSKHQSNAHISNGTKHIVDGGSDKPYFISIDIDSSAGWGPETISLYKKTGHSYRLYVSNETIADGPLDESDAVLKMYRGSKIIQSINVPCKSSGNGMQFWDIMTYRSQNETFEIFNLLVMDEPSILKI